MSERPQQNATNLALKRKQLIYLLPNLFTTGVLFCGFLALSFASQQAWHQAAIAIVVGGILDGFDGRIARLTNTQSEFGVQYDSLSDLVCFGVAPAFLCLSLANSSTLEISARLPFIIAFFHGACVAIRLAFFNTQTANEEDKSFFKGLPCPTAAGMIATWVWMHSALNNEMSDGKIVFLMVLVPVLGLLMVSNFSYYSFKQINFKRRIHFFSILLITLFLALITLKPALFLFSIGMVYLFSGPIIFFMKRKKINKDISLFDDEVIIEENRNQDEVNKNE